MELQEKQEKRIKRTKEMLLRDGLNRDGDY